MTVIAAGEALIDLAPHGGELRPLPGGSPFNVAVGLARLGVDTGYLGRLSCDGFGQRLRDGLSAEGVYLGLTTTTDDPTTLAVVHLDDRRQASYAFYLDGTSAAGLRAPLPALPDGATLHVSLGAIGLEHPAGQALADLVLATVGDHVRTLDPNLRPSAVTDPDAYARRMASLVAACDLVKVSDEDLRLLYPDREVMETAADWAASGPAAVVLTRGAEGAVAITSDGHHLDVAGREVTVVDTVGAGDAFMSGLLAGLDVRGHLDDRASLDAAVTGGALEQALEHAVLVAALTCTREGANPPTDGEVTDAAS